VRIEETPEYRSYLCLAKMCGTLVSDHRGSDGDYDDSGYFEEHITELFGAEIDTVFSSQDVYGVFGNKRWAFTRDGDGLGHNLNARLFHDRDHNVYYLVHRPTQSGNHDDNVNNVLTVIGAGVPDKFQQAAQLMEHVRPEYRDQIVLVGYSLGGALAAYAATRAPWPVRTIVFDPLGLNRRMMGRGGWRPFGHGESLSDRFRALDDHVDWLYIGQSWLADLNYTRHLSSVGRVTRLPEDRQRATNSHDLRHVRFGLHQLWEDKGLFRVRGGVGV
jgi:pimeloyl-ACP methyl ester carboxylesterase